MRSFLVTLLICSVTMSVTALCYMAVTPLLAKHYSVKVLYYSWLVVVLGLIIPFRPKCSNAIVKVNMPDSTAGPVVRIGTGAAAALPASGPHTVSAALPVVPWWQITAALWLAGMILFLACHIIRHYRFLKLVSRWSDDITDNRTLALFQRLKTQMGLSREIGLQTCESIGSPMMTGFANPASCCRRQTSPQRSSVSSSGTNLSIINGRIFGIKAWCCWQMQSTGLIPLSI